MERQEADIKAEKAVVTSGCKVFEFGPKLVSEEEEEADGACYIQGTGGEGDDSVSVNDTQLDVEEMGLGWWEVTGEDSGEEARRWGNNPRINTSVDDNRHYLFCHLESTGCLLPHDGSGGILSPVSLPTLTRSHNKFRDKLKMAVRTVAVSLHSHGQWNCYCSFWISLGLDYFQEEQIHT